MLCFVFKTTANVIYFSSHIQKIFFKMALSLYYMALRAVFGINSLFF